MHSWIRISLIASLACQAPYVRGGFFPASDKRLTVVGRTLDNSDSNGSLSFDWPGVHITARVQGSAASIWLSEPPPGVPGGTCVRCIPPYDFGMRYIVFLDGKLHSKLNTTAIPRSVVTEWPLFSDASASEHIVRLEVCESECFIPYGLGARSRVVEICSRRGLI